MKSIHDLIEEYDGRIVQSESTRPSPQQYRHNAIRLRHQLVRRHNNYLFINTMLSQLVRSTPNLTSVLLPPRPYPGQQLLLLPSNIIRNINCPRSITKIVECKVTIGERFLITIIIQIRQSAIFDLCSNFIAEGLRA